MKYSLLTIIGLVIAFAAAATVRNVSNSPSGIANPPYSYNSLQTAVDSASDGDSLYVSGTNINYGSITITNKTLTLIGAGYGNNLQSNFQQKTYVNDITFDGYTGVKNIVLVGFYVPGIINTQNTGAVNNLLIDRCGLHRLACYCNNLIVHQSLFEVGCDGDATFRPIVIANAVVQNSVITGNINGNNINSVIFENNIFKRTDCSVGTISNFNGVALFTNNIFNDDYGIGVSNCTFNNNLLVGYTGLSNNNNGNGNLFNTAASFVNNASPTNAIGIANFCTTVNYHLASGSPCIGSGSNGGDMGVYGGTNALPATAILNGVPAMPRITEMNLQNISVAPNGNLNVQIKAVREN